jgi:hypothetical protein
MPMEDRRIDPRLLCADLVETEFKDRTGRRRVEAANLEDISSSGACLQMEVPIGIGTIVRIKHGKGILQGRVKYCVFREIGYFLGVEFDAGHKWSQKQFRPMHLLDPRRVGAKRAE